MTKGEPMIPWSARRRRVPDPDAQRPRPWAEWRDAPIAQTELARSPLPVRPWVARIKNHRGAVESRRFSDPGTACNWLLQRRAVVDELRPPPLPFDPPDMEWRNWV